MLFVLCLLLSKKIFYICFNHFKIFYKYAPNSIFNTSYLFYTTQTMKFQLFCFILFYTFFCIVARIFDRCSLARELSRLGVPRGDIPAWVCIAQYESTYNTAAIGPLNSDGSRDWGLFQLNDRFWCDPQDGRRTSNVCGIPCRSLTTDDIGTSLRCALQIQREQGFGAWTVWNRQCRGGGASPNIDDCL